MVCELCDLILYFVLELGRPLGTKLSVPNYVAVLYF